MENKKQKIIDSLKAANEAVNQANQALNDAMQELDDDELDQVVGAGSPFGDNRVPVNSLDPDVRGRG